MISRDELNARAKRLNPYQPVNRYTGTLNDPMQEAQSAYAGPEWAQYFGSLQKTQEDAQNAGMRYRVDFGDFGNTRSTQESGMPSRRRGTLAELGGDRLSDADAGRQFDEDVMRTRVGQLGLAAMQRQDAAERDAVQQNEIARMRADEDRARVASAFAPPVGDTTIARQARPGQSELITGRPNIAATPADPRKVLETQIQRLPVNHPIRLEMEKRIAAQDVAAKESEAKLVKAQSEATAATAGALSPDAIDANAQLYLQTGTMPTLGMKDPGNRAKILNRAAELSAGGAAGNVAANKADYKADTGSLVGLQKQRDAVGAFEDTALKNLDVFLEAAKKVPDLGSPLLNKPLRAISEQGLGSADLAAYNAARRTVIPEFAKILSNPGLAGQLSDTARKEVEEVLSGNATLAQTLAVANTLKTDAANRRTSYDDQLKVIRGRIAKPGSSSGAVASTPSVNAKDPLGIR